METGGSIAIKSNLSLKLGSFKPALRLLLRFFSRKKKKKGIILPSLILQILAQLLKMREIKEAKEEQDLEKVKPGLNHLNLAEL